MHPAVLAAVMVNPEEPADLCRRLAAGSESALAEAFARYRPRMERVVRLRLHPALLARLDPEDVVQEAFLAAEKRRSAFDADRATSVWVWLRLVLAQTLVDLQRAHFGHKRNAARDSPLGGLPGGSSGSLSQRLAASITPPSSAAARAELQTRVHAMLSEMDPVDRELLVLRHFEDATNREAAELLGLPPSTASDRYLRALQRLRAALGEGS
ncbi:MAG: sigma-70 family RNA polymerase sigma factor [Planctomycetes bacterium]|nr:sigma-70 family RNA polymerase sigma factor [Planctomycetota bacterium]